MDLFTLEHTQRRMGNKNVIWDIIIAPVMGHNEGQNCKLRHTNRNESLMIAFDEHPLHFSGPLTFLIAELQRARNKMLNVSRCFYSFENSLSFSFLNNMTRK